MVNKSENRQLKKYLSLMQAIIDYAQDKVYFQISELKQALKATEVQFNDESVKKYLYQLKKASQLFGAGRGWYSNISQPFLLETEPLHEITGRLHRQFPLLTFCCWSTAQLQSWFHHLLGKSLLFVYVEKDVLGPVYDDLRQHNANCYLDPQKRELQQSFRISTDAIIIRPSISEEPQKGHYATMGKILVDLFIERNRLEMFDEWEYQNLFEAIVMNNRIDMAGLMRYASRRNVKDKIQNLIH